ncbi:MAG: transporter [Oscillospiraceae bacterium]|nr:MAG: transporter [Oscillospiraceae bacterium]
MDILENLLAGFQTIFCLDTMIYLFVGTFLGTIIGALPGMGASTGTSILLPLTFSMSPLNALVMLMGVYYGTQYGGSLTAILINIPGTSSSAITAVDGYALMKRGKGAIALGAAQFSSFIGGMISTVLLTVCGVSLARVALKFSAPEYFALTLMGLTLVSGLTGNYPAKGYMMMLFGMALGCVGIDTVSGIERFAFDSLYLVDGFKTVPILVGLLGFSELLGTIEKGPKNQDNQGLTTKVRVADMIPSRRDWKEILPSSLRGTVIGFVVGALPGAGATISSVLAYGYQKKRTHNPDFGNGAVDGVSAAESSNNASTGGAMVPMLALGIPGSPTTAILMTALVMFGMKTGPQLFTTNGTTIWAVIASMYIGNVFLLVINILMVPLLIFILHLAQDILTPLVAALCIVGVYSLYGRIFDVGIMLLFAVIGYFFKKFNFPILPLILGVILGPTAESSFRQAMVMSGGSVGIFLTRPISCIMLLVCVVSFFYTPIKERLRSKSGQ